MSRVAVLGLEQLIESDLCVGDLSHQVSEAAKAWCSDRDKQRFARLFTTCQIGEAFGNPFAARKSFAVTDHR
jgi:hypothetical protein